MEFMHLLSPMKVGRTEYRNRIVSAPMAFGLLVQNEEAREVSYRKVASAAAGGNAACIVGEVDVNFRDAVRIPGFRKIDFSRPHEDEETFQAVAEYARRIQRHGAKALIELAHPGREKVPFGSGEEAVGPVACTNMAGIPVRAMNQEDMNRIAEDFSKAACYMKEAGFDGVLIHGGHGFLITQFLSPLMNTRTDAYGGSLENRSRFPLQIIKSVRKAVGEDFLIELRIDGTDRQPNGITPEETGAFVKMAEAYLTSVHITCGIYEESVKSGTESSMFHPHGLNVADAAIVKKYTSLPVGVVGGINSPEMCEEIIAEGKVDFVVLGRQMLADPEFANKCRDGKPEDIRRCLRCYKCFPGSPEEGYEDLPFTSEELALHVGSCTINPLAHLPFNPEEIPHSERSAKVAIVGAGVAGMEAAIRFHDRGHQVRIYEKTDKMGGLLRFTDVDIDKPDLRNFKNMMAEQAMKRNIPVVYGTEITPDSLASLDAEVLVIAAGSRPSCPSVPGIEHAVQAMDVYDGKVIPGKKVVMIGGGLVGCETGLYLQKTGHQVTVVEMLGRIANEAFGMYREALVWEMEKSGVVSYVQTRCLEILPGQVRIEHAAGEQTLEADTVIYALGMKSVDTTLLQEAAKARGMTVHVIGDAVRPGKVDGCTRSAYLASVADELEKRNEKE